MIHSPIPCSFTSAFTHFAIANVQNSWQQRKMLPKLKPKHDTTKYRAKFTSSSAITGKPCIIVIIIIIIIIIDEFHRDTSLNKTSGPLCVTCYTSVNVAGWVSFGQKWKTIFCRQYRSIFNHCNVIDLQSYRIQ